jgi:DNA-binding NarL/FixJ family response regulator
LGDQSMMRTDFEAVLEVTGNIEVVGEAGTGEAAVQAATQHVPEVALMDIRMPVMDGRAHDVLTCRVVNSLAPRPLGVGCSLRLALRPIIPA